MKLLGWEIINPLKRNLKNIKALVPKDDDSGAYSPSSGEAMASFFSFDQDASYNSDIDLISKYRNLTFIPEVDMAIEEIINEIIVSSENEPIVTLNLDQLEVSDSFKERIEEEFNYILNLLDFQNSAYEYARRWYIDGRIYFHILINMNNPRQGILDIRQLDSMNIRKVKEVDRENDENQIPVIKEVREYFVYSDKGIQTNRSTMNSEIRISADSVAYSNSGIIDPNSGIILSNLHKALKIANHLSMIETALVIYRLTRAPERRVFYIDTGDLPKQKAEEYLREQMNRHRNKLSYDVTTGQLIDQKSILSMMEDYWMPRRGGTRGTEITTLESGQNLQNMEDVQYFKEKLYKSLNVPILRLQPDASVSYSKDSAIIREELKFAKFIDKQRKKFSFFLYDLLRKQLILKNLITPAEWTSIKQSIFIKFQKDSFYSEIKEAELLADRLSLLNDMSSFLGTMFSNNFAYKHIFKLDNTDIEDIRREIEEEKENKNQKEDGMYSGDTSLENDFSIPADSGFSDQTSGDELSDQTPEEETAKPTTQEKETEA